MKKIFNILAVTVLFIAVMVSCKETKVTEVRLNKTELTLKVNETETLIATVLPEKADNKDVIWNSSNNTVATVDNGTITTKLAGTAIITIATLDGNKTANCTVTVTETLISIEEPEMIFVEGGVFLFGCTDEEYKEYEEWEQHLWQSYPPVQTTVGNFYISKYLVTQKLWKEIMGSSLTETLSYGKGDDYPMYNVSCLDMSEFVKKLNFATGKNYRTPSSIEWEYAARGGNKSMGYKYSGSNNIDEVAWYNGNSNNSTHPVGKKLPNELGIYDMSGNVNEWIGGYYHHKTNIEFIRGGSWGNDEKGCWVSYSSWYIARMCSSDIGFRLVLPVSE